MWLYEWLYEFVMTLFKMIAGGLITIMVGILVILVAIPVILSPLIQPPPMPWWGWFKSYSDADTILLAEHAHDWNRCFNRDYYPTVLQIAWNRLQQKIHGIDQDLGCDRRCATVVAKITKTYILNAVDACGRTPLYNAIERGAVETAKALLRRVPDVELYPERIESHLIGGMVKPISGCLSIQYISTNSTGAITMGNKAPYPTFATISDAIVRAQTRLERGYETINALLQSITCITKDPSGITMEYLKPSAESAAKLTSAASAYKAWHLSSRIA